MIKINTISNHKTWKRYLKNPNGFIQNKTNKLNKKFKKYKKRSKASNRGVVRKSRKPNIYDTRWNRKTVHVNKTKSIFSTAKRC